MQTRQLVLTTVGFVVAMALAVVALTALFDNIALAVAPSLIFAYAIARACWAGTAPTSPGASGRASGAGPL